MNLTLAEFNLTLYSSAFNFSLDKARDILELHYRRDRVFDPSTEGGIITAYVFLIASGVFCNLLVSGVILSHAKIRTNRNLFVVNLSISDTALCLMCMPFTVYSLTRKTWPMGQLLCKLVPCFQGATIFVSAATVTAIAVDRYQSVVSCNLQRPPNGRRRVSWYTGAIWVFSLALSLPICLSQNLQKVGLSVNYMHEKCVEQWPSPGAKQLYTLSILIIQFVIPTTSLVVTHFRIKSHLSCAASPGANVDKRGYSERLQRELRRNRRATMVLLNVSVVFAVSWLPWNVMNLLTDFHLQGIAPQRLYLIFAVCHMVAMSSTTTNPIMYGWLNTNIRRELMGVRTKVGTMLGFHRTSNSDNNFQTSVDDNGRTAVTTEKSRL
ncbi:neuropeptide Y receptor type 6-like [Ornithodoros turicata]|uniref:neuropeptide Y receptor type 6-like n=1 Tax=Ornithodoros turicata TaxID=34597 RepID=UPI003138FE0E